MAEMTAITDENGIATFELTPEFIDVPLVADVIPPPGRRDAPNYVLEPIPDGADILAQPFFLAAKQARVRIPVVDPDSGVGLAGVAVVLKVGP